MKSLLIAIFSTILFTQTQIGLTNIQYIEFKDGGRILRPTFSPDGKYLVVEQFGGSKSSKIEHDRVARAIIKTILLSLQEFSIGGVSRARGAKKLNA